MEEEAERRCSWGDAAGEGVMTKKVLGQTARKHFEAKEQAKLLYGVADRLLNEVLPHVKPGEEIQLYDDKGQACGKAVLKNNFAKGNVQWGHGSVRQLELERL